MNPITKHVSAIKKRKEKKVPKKMRAKKRSNKKLVTGSQTHSHTYLVVCFIDRHNYQHRVDEFNR